MPYTSNLVTDTAIKTEEGKKNPDYSMYINTSAFDKFSN